ncbi:hypothetical protein QF042_003121 [Pedobacter sp. W3I1]|nr:hypothetical protein [Pedobacter sp. W3I1]
MWLVWHRSLEKKSWIGFSATVEMTTMRINRRFYQHSKILTIKIEAIYDLLVFYF